eukprot:scaffold5.g709.t1
MRSERFKASGSSETEMVARKLLDSHIASCRGPPPTRPLHPPSLPTCRRSPPPVPRQQVLFCGRDMHYGYAFTAEALHGEPGVEVVQCTRQDVAEQIRDADVAVPLMSQLDAELLRSAERLKLVIQYGVGVEGIDIPTATELGIWVANIHSAGTGNAISCAEHAIFLMLATLRDTTEMAASIAMRRLGQPLGQTLYGKCVLVVGFGNIAKELIVRLQAFGVTISALRRQAHWGQAADALTAAAEAALAAKGCWPADTARLAADADLVVLTCHQDASSRGMVNAEFLGHCKQGVRIVNVARGGLLDYEAVLAGLDSGLIGFLGLDVQASWQDWLWQEPIDPEDPTVQHPRVYLSPHIAGVTEMSYRNMAQIVGEEVQRLRAGRPPKRQLNRPPQPRAGDRSEGTVAAPANPRYTGAGNLKMSGMGLRAVLVAIVVSLHLAAATGAEGSWTCSQTEDGGEHMCRPGELMAHVDNTHRGPTGVLEVPDRFLMGPGPANAHPRILAAQTMPLLGHMHPPFLAIMDEIQQGLRYLFQTTSNYTLASLQLPYTLNILASGTGHAGMEMCIANLLEPGETLLVGNNGIWGTRVADMAERYGANVVELKTGPGRTFSLEELTAAVQQHKPAVLFLAQGESSTGAHQSLAGLGDLCRRTGTLLLVDAVCSLGGVPLFADKWGIDAVYTGSQKCLSAPPGAAPVMFSERAVAKIHSRKTKVRSYYLDLNLVGDYWGWYGSRSYHHTGMVSMWYAMREALAIVAEEGLSNMWTRHAAAHAQLWEGLTALGLEPFVEHPEDRLATVPPGVDWAALSKLAMDKYSVEIAGGLGGTVGKVWRVGVMGANAKPATVELVLAAFKDGLRQQGFAKGGTAAATAEAKQLLSPADWAALPTPCPGLGRALLAMLARSAAEAALLVMHLPDAARGHLRALALNLARLQRRLRLELPEGVVRRILAAAPLEAERERGEELALRKSGESEESARQSAAEERARRAEESAAWELEESRQRSRKEADTAAQLAAEAHKLRQRLEESDSLRQTVAAEAAALADCQRASEAALEGARRMQQAAEQRAQTAEQRAEAAEQRAGAVGSKEKAQDHQ